MKKDVLITGKRGFIGRRISGGKSFKGNLLDKKALMSQVEDMVGIVHLAAKSDRRICERNPKAAIESNLMGLCNVLEVALEKDLWVLFISTFQVSERNIYGLTKLMGEELCRMYQKYGVKLKIVRFPIVYGPDDKTDKVFSRILHMLKYKVEPDIETEDDFYFLYVDDAVEVIENEVDILNGGFGKPYTLRELTAGIKECLKEE